MKRAWLSLLPLLLLGCSSGGDDALPDVGDATGNAAALHAADDELAALDVGSDELVADDLDTPDDPSDAVVAAMPTANGFDDGDETDLEEESDEASTDAPDVLDDPPADELGDVEGDRAFSDASSALLESAMSNDRLPSWWSKTFRCPTNPTHSDCVCRGSLYNCPFPNAQPQRNRYLPSSAMRELARTSGRLLRDEIAAKLGRWEVRPGTGLYDGAGVLRGTLSGTCYAAHRSSGRLAFESLDPSRACVRVNFGQVKRMKVDGMTSKRRFVYVFDTFVHAPPGSGLPSTDASGWIPLSAILDPAFKAYDTPPRRAPHFASTSYVLKSAEDYGCTQPAYGSTRCLPAWAQLKVRPMSRPEVSEKARDYLLRDGNVLNLAYQTPLLGGAATDTFLVRHDALAFRRARSIDPNRRTILRISLYETMSKRRVRTMAFVYGEIAGRFGWVAASALKEGTVAAETASAGNGNGNGGGGAGAVDACSGKPDGVYCNPYIGPAAYVCQGGHVAAERQCAAAGQTCVGPNGSGVDIVCR